MQISNIMSDTMVDIACVLNDLQLLSSLTAGKTLSSSTKTIVFHDSWSTAIWRRYARESRADTLTCIQNIFNNAFKLLEGKVLYDFYPVSTSLDNALIGVSSLVETYRSDPAMVNSLNALIIDVRRNISAYKQATENVLPPVLPGDSLVEPGDSTCQDSSYPDGSCQDSSYPGAFISIIDTMATAEPFQLDGGDIDNIQKRNNESGPCSQPDIEELVEVPNTGGIRTPNESCDELAAARYDSESDSDWSILFDGTVNTDIETSTNAIPSAMNDAESHTDTQIHSIWIMDNTGSLKDTTSSMIIAPMINNDALSEDFFSNLPNHTKDLGTIVVPGNINIITTDNDNEDFKKDFGQDLSQDLSQDPSQDLSQCLLQSTYVCGEFSSAIHHYASLPPRTKYPELPALRPLQPLSNLRIVDNPGVHFNKTTGKLCHRRFIPRMAGELPQDKPPAFDKMRTDICNALDRFSQRTKTRIPSMFGNRVRYHHRRASYLDRFGRADQNI